MRTIGPTAEEVAEQTRQLRDWIAHYQEIVDRLQRGGQPPENDKLWDDRSLEMWGHKHVAIPSMVRGAMLDLIYCGRCQ